MPVFVVLGTIFRILNTRARKEQERIYSQILAKTKQPTYVYPMVVHSKSSKRDTVKVNA